MYGILEFHFKSLDLNEVNEVNDYLNKQYKDVEVRISNMYHNHTGVVFLLYEDLSYEDLEAEYFYINLKWKWKMYEDYPEDQHWNELFREIR